VSPSGTTATARIRRTGYMLNLRGWAMGENLAWGTGSFSTPANIVQAWLDSPGHKRNLLDRRWRETGISVVVGSPVDARGLNAGTYAQTFGVRRR
jgi:uncharacterized protein YkwD